MSILNGNQIIQLIDDGVIIGASKGLVSAASLDVRLSDRFLLEDLHKQHRVISLRNAEAFSSFSVMGEGGLMLEPGDFALGSSMEQFNLPDTISAMFILVSTGGRMGLNHMQSGWMDAGGSGYVLTLELKNELRKHTIQLEAGVIIGQVVFFSHEPAGEFSYEHKGRYNGKTTVTPALPRKEFFDSEV
jgi:dCTP deaminase